MVLQTPWTLKIATVARVCIRVILGFYRDNGKENGNYHHFVIWGKMDFTCFS